MNVGHYFLTVLKWILAIIVIRNMGNPDRYVSMVIGSFAVILALVEIAQIKYISRLTRKEEKTEKKK